MHSTGGSWPHASTATNDLTSYEASFLSSLLDHLPGVTALTLPQPASYVRVGDGVWSGGTYICWGTDNREAPVRLCNANSPSARNFELRFIDGLANVSTVELIRVDLMLTKALDSLIWRLRACWVRVLWASRKEENFKFLTPMARSAQLIWARRKGGSMV